MKRLIFCSIISLMFGFILGRDRSVEAQSSQSCSKAILHIVFAVNDSATMNARNSENYDNEGQRWKAVHWATKYLSDFYFHFLEKFAPDCYDFKISFVRFHQKTEIIDVPQDTTGTIMENVLQLSRYNSDRSVLEGIFERLPDLLKSCAGIGCQSGSDYAETWSEIKRSLFRDPSVEKAVFFIGDGFACPEACDLRSTHELQGFSTEDQKTIYTIQVKHIFEGKRREWQKFLPYSVGAEPKQFTPTLAALLGHLIEKWLEQHPLSGDSKFSFVDVTPRGVPSSDPSAIYKFPFSFEEVSFTNLYYLEPNNRHIIESKVEKKRRRFTTLEVIDAEPGPGDYVLRQELTQLPPPLKDVGEFKRIDRLIIYSRRPPIDDVRHSSVLVQYQRAKLTLRYPKSNLDRWGADLYAEVSGQPQTRSLFMPQSDDQWEAFLPLATPGKYDLVVSMVKGESREDLYNKTINVGRTEVEITCTTPEDRVLLPGEIVPITVRVRFRDLNSNAGLSVGQQTIEELAFDWNEQATVNNQPRSLGNPAATDITTTMVDYSWNYLVSNDNQQEISFDIRFNSDGDPNDTSSESRLEKPIAAKSCPLNVATLKFTAPRSNQELSISTSNDKIELIMELSQAPDYDYDKWSEGLDWKCEVAGDNFYKEGDFTLFEGRLVGRLDLNDYRGFVRNPQLTCKAYYQTSNSRLDIDTVTFNVLLP